MQECRNAELQECRDNKMNRVTCHASRVTVLPTAYLPPIAYVSEVLRSDEVIIEIHETYTKQTSRNRCDIYGPNGRQTLSIPVVKVNGNHTLIRDIRISNNSRWQSIHWRSIETAYSNAPYFLYYRDLFYPAFRKRFEFLLDFNQSLLESVFRSMKAHKPIRFTATYDKLVDRTISDSLVAKRVTINNPEYRQVFHERHGFLPNLSVIDAIFNLGPETADYFSSCPVFS